MIEYDYQLRQDKLRLASWRQLKEQNLVCDLSIVEKHIKQLEENIKKYTNANKIPCNK